MKISKAPLTWGGKFIDKDFISRKPKKTKKNKWKIWRKTFIKKYISIIFLVEHLYDKHKSQAI